MWKSALQVRLKRPHETFEALERGEGRWRHFPIVQHLEGNTSGEESPEAFVELELCFDTPVNEIVNEQGSGVELHRDRWAVVDAERQSVPFRGVPVEENGEHGCEDERSLFF